MSTPELLTTTAADILDRRFTFDEHLKGCEGSYRRGVHHGVSLAADLIGDATSLAEARRILARADAVAADYRNQGRHPGRPPIVDEIRGKMARRRKPAIGGRA